MAKRISKDMIIAEMLELDEAIAPILMGAGMHCIYCGSALSETLEEAAEVHGLDVNFLVNGINAYLMAKEGNEEA